MSDEDSTRYYVNKAPFKKLLNEALLCTPREYISSPNLEVKLSVTNSSNASQIFNINTSYINRWGDKDYEQIVQVRVTPWVGCCALCILSFLRVSRWGRNSGPLIKAIREAILDYYAGREKGWTRAYFSYSEEEIEYHKKLVEDLGFTEEVSPQVSVGTTHMIHTAWYDVAPQDEIEGAMEVWEYGGEDEF